MVDFSTAGLFKRFSPVALDSIMGAGGLSRMRGHQAVELVHWIHTLLEDPGNDVAEMRRKYGLDDAALVEDVIGALDALPRVRFSDPKLSPQMHEAAANAWLYGSVLFDATRVRTGYVLLAMLETPDLRDALVTISPEFEKIDADDLVERWGEVLGGSHEHDQDHAAAEVAAVSGDAPIRKAIAKDGPLAAYSVDLTQRARDGEIDKIVGRDAEIRQVVDILLRRRQNNPILIGEAGVGKTAVAEGFARRVVDGDVPPALAGVSVHALDIGLLQAGASMKGEFEKRLRALIEEVEASPQPIILFIDEAHTLIGAGGAAGTGDAANLLKPALARGRLRSIAATTYAEYRKYFEKDPALTRRFQTVQVDEPSTATAVAMIRSLADIMEKHHKVSVLDEAIEAAVTLSQRYVPARQLPDKAVSLLDTACARVAVSQHATPGEVEGARRRLEMLGVELAAAKREAALGFPTGDRILSLSSKIEEAQAAVETVEARWRAEKVAVEAMLAAREALSRAQGAAREAAVVALDEARGAAEALLGDAPMVFGQVDKTTVAAVVADWTGVPVGRMVKNEIQQTLGMAARLRDRVIGQDHALEAIARRLQTARARLDNPSKPIGVFMLCGPSGVGKTETAHALAELMYGGASSLITINMSEFQEAHTVATLKGAPPGYVGYGEGGVLTEAVRRRPYSVVLLDEVEKAHPDVHEVFFQVFDKGVMEDGEGRKIDFRNTLILLTSNVGTQLISAAAADPETAPAPEALAAALRPDLLKVFPPALLGRLVVAPYYPLSPQMLGGIVRLQLNRIVERVVLNHGVPLTYDDAVVDLIVSRCTETDSGGRMIDAIVTNTLLPELATRLLAAQLEGQALASVGVGVEGGDFSYRVTLA